MRHIIKTKVWWYSITTNVIFKSKYYSTILPFSIQINVYTQLIHDKIEVNFIENNELTHDWPHPPPPYFNFQLWPIEVPELLHLLDPLPPAPLCASKVTHNNTYYVKRSNREGNILCLLFIYLYSDGGVADLRLKNKFPGTKHEVL